MLKESAGNAGGTASHRADGSSHERSAAPGRSPGAEFAVVSQSRARRRQLAAADSVGGSRRAVMPAATMWVPVESVQASRPISLEQPQPRSRLAAARRGVATPPAGEHAFWPGAAGQKGSWRASSSSCGRSCRPGDLVFECHRRPMEALKGLDSTKELAPPSGLQTSRDGRGSRALAAVQGLSDGVEQAVRTMVGIQAWLNWRSTRKHRIGGFGGRRAVCRDGGRGSRSVPSRLQDCRAAGRRSCSSSRPNNAVTVNI